MNDYLNEIVAITKDGTELNRDQYIDFLTNIIKEMNEIDQNKEKYYKEQISIQENIEIEKLIDIAEQLSLALSFKSTVPEVDNFKQGVTMVYNTVIDYLEMSGVKKMNSFGQVFNPEYHDALVVEDVKDENQKGRIIKVVNEGYLYNGKLLKPAVVIVGK